MGTACSSALRYPGQPAAGHRRVKDAVNELAHVYAELKLWARACATSTSAAGSASITRQPLPTTPSSSTTRLGEYARRRRLTHREVARRGIDTRDRERVRARDRRAPQPAGIHTLGGSMLDKFQSRGMDGGPRRDPGLRAGAGPYRRYARSRSGGSSSATTTPSRPASRRCRCSTSATEPRGARPGRARVLGHLREDRDHCRACRRCQRNSRGSSRS